MPNKPAYEELEQRVKELEQALSEREKSEEAIRESQARFQLLYERAPLGYQSLDEDGNSIEVNPAWLDMLGYTREEVIGKSFSEFLHPDWKDHFKENFSRLKALGEVLGVEFEMVKKDGSTILVSFNGKIGKDKYGGFQQRHCIFQDITERKKAEEERRESEERFRNLIEGSIQGILIHRNSKPLFVNQAYADMHGYTPEEIFRMESTEQLISLQDQSRLLEYKNARLRGESAPIYYEYRGVRKDGALVWMENKVRVVEWDGQPAIQSTVFNISERKQAVEALRESEERNRILIEAADRSGEAIIVHQKRNEKEAVCVFANHTAVKITGYKQEELSSLSWFDILNTDYRDAAKGRYKRRLDGEDIPGFFELSIIRKDSSEVLIEGASIRTEFQNKNALVTFFRDITEEKRKEGKLKESEERYRSLVELSPETIFVHQDGKIVYINPEGTKMFGGTSSEEIIGKSLLDFISPDYHEIVKTRTKQIYEDKKSLSEIELKILRLDKKVIDVLATGTSVDYMGQPASLGVVRDITERKKAEEALQEGEERYRRLIELNPDGMYLSRKGKIIYVNQATVDILGAKSKDELIGNSIFDLIHPDYLEKAKQRNQLMAEQGVSVPLSDFIFYRLDKEEIHVQALASPVIFKGEPCVLSAIRDVTEQKRAETEKAKLESQLQHSQKLEAIGTLAGGIAHDFNNILTPFILHTEMALMSIPEDSPVRHNLKEALNAGHRARDLVKQILTFSRQREEECKPFRVGLNMKETIKLLRASLPTTIEIKQHVETESDWVVTTQTYIHQVLMNLCTNAAHAMRDNGGTLYIRLEDLQLDSTDTIQFSDLKPGTYVRMTVTDTGHGMNLATKNRIFEPYFTSKEKDEGTGLGLSVVHGIVKDLGGAITVESELGKGSTFKVLFPTIENEISEETEHISEILKGNERILYVDDEMPMVETVQELLEQLGYQVTTRTSSIEALELFREKSDSFDLVITDQTMPNMTGDELAIKLLQIRPDIPIILCTGFSEKIDERRAKDLGIRAFVMKPIVMSEISNTIREVLED